MPCGMFMLRRRPNNAARSSSTGPTPAFEAMAYRAALGQRDINPALLDLTMESEDEELACEDCDRPAPDKLRTSASARKRRPSMFDAPQLLITPRMAAKMYWRCKSLMEGMERRSAASTAHIASLLPAEAQWVANNDACWWEQFSQSLERTLGRLSQGREPKPSCNGDVIACKMVIDVCADMEARTQNQDISHLMQHLPCHNLDSDFDLMRDLLLSEYDILFATDLVRKGYTFSVDAPSSPELDAQQQTQQQHSQQTSRPGGARSISPLTPRQAAPLPNRGYSFSSLVQVSQPASPCLAIHETVSEASRTYVHPRDWFIPFNGNATPCNSLRPSLDNQRHSPTLISHLPHL